MSLTRDLGTVTSATLVSRGLALLRDMGVAGVLGAGALSDAYFAAIQIPNLFRKLLAEGALNGALVPAWLRLAAGDEATARRFAERLFGTMLLLLGGFALLCVVFAPAAIHLVAPGFPAGSERFADAVTFLRWSVGYVAVAGLAAIAVAILNAEGRVAAAAGSIAAFNCILVGAVLLAVVLGTGTSKASGILLAVSFALGGLVQLVLLAAALRRALRRPRCLRLAWSADIRRFYGRAASAVIAGGVPALTFIAGTIIASSSASAVSWLYYAYRLYELPLGIVTIATASVLAPRIAVGVQQSDDATSSGAQSRAFEIAMGLGLPAAAGFALLASPIAGVLFERGAFTAADTAAVAAAILALAAGLPGHALEKVLAAISYAHEDARAPMLAGLVGLAVSTGAALALFPSCGHVGIAAALAGAGWISALVLAAILLRRRRLRPERGTAARLAGIAGAAALMGAVLLLCRQYGPHVQAGLPSTAAQFATLVVLIPLGIAIYVLGLRLFGVVRIGELIAGLRGHTH